MLRYITLNTDHHTGCCHCSLTGNLSAQPQHPPHDSFFSLICCSHKALRRICIFSKQFPTKAQETEWLCSNWTAYLNPTPQLCYWAVLLCHRERVGTQPLSSSLGKQHLLFYCPNVYPTAIPLLSHCLLFEDYLSPWLRTQIYLLSASWPE